MISNVCPGWGTGNWEHMLYVEWKTDVCPKYETELSWPQKISEGVISLS